MQQADTWLSLSRRFTAVELLIREQEIAFYVVSGGTAGAGEEGERRSQAGPRGPADSIVSIHIHPSRQGPTLDTSSTSASPTVTALALRVELRMLTTSRRSELGCGHCCGRPQWPALGFPPRDGMLF